MTVFRVPYPEGPDRRNAIFARAQAIAAPYGAIEGTPEAGAFQANTPLGAFRGSFRSLDGPAELELTLTHKPWLVPNALIEREVRKFVLHA